MNLISENDIRKRYDTLGKIFDKKLYLGFLNVHILYHASKEPVYGTWLIEELAHHGYHIGPSHLYPLLKSLTDDGLLSMEKQLEQGKIRKYYRITPQGRILLEELKAKAIELTNELCEEDMEASLR